MIRNFTFISFSGQICIVKKNVNSVNNLSRQFPSQWLGNPVAESWQNFRIVLESEAVTG
jgi:hypothetical protein